MPAGLTSKEVLGDDGRLCAGPSLLILTEWCFRLEFVRGVRAHGLCVKFVEKLLSRKMVLLYKGSAKLKST